MKILRQVKTSERLPNKSGIYHCKRFNEDNEITLCFVVDKIHYINKFKNIEYWYEPIEIGLDSEKVFQKEKRLNTDWTDENLNEQINSSTKAYYLLERYHKALETSELKNIQLQNEVNNL